MLILTLTHRCEPAAAPLGPRADIWEVKYFRGLIHCFFSRGVRGTTLSFSPVFPIRCSYPSHPRGAEVGVLCPVSGTSVGFGSGFTFPHEAFFVLRF